jgi:FHA domain
MVMLNPGEFRRQISIELNAAYGDGLLSEQTLAHRLDLVLSGRLLDPERLIGDLSLRASRRSRRNTVGRGVDSLRDTFTRRKQPAGVSPPLVLALEWDHDDGQLLVGRDPDSCDVVLDHPTVSRKHAQLHHRDGAWVLQDLDSTNGTTINGKRVMRCRLEPGDRIMLGRQAVVVD